MRVDNSVNKLIVAGGLGLAAAGGAQYLLAAKAPGLIIGIWKVVGIASIVAGTTVAGVGAIKTVQNIIVSDDVDM